MGETQSRNLLRLFAAIELTEEARRAAVAHASRLRTMLPQGVKASWEREEKLHLTMKFFGNVAPERVGELTEALARTAAASQPFRLRLQETGVFPTPSRPSVLWLGLSDPSGELARGGASLE